VRRLATFGVLGLVALLFAGVIVTKRFWRDPPPYPCISTSRSGWLTAVGSGLLVRIEWSEASGQVSIGREHDPIRWQTVGSDAARRTANRVLEPVAGTGTAAPPGRVSVTVGCDADGHFWSGGGAAFVPWSECLWPGTEERLHCLKRAITSRRLTDRATERIASGLLERLTSFAAHEGVTP
jgi:hypothetical protein